MILSVSRRTDIPCRHNEWFMNRIRAGYAVVRNPMNPGQLGRIALTPDVVDCIVFWSKDPAPLMPYLKELDARGYRYYFQFTLTPYGKNLEPGLRDKKEIEDCFRELARRVGSERIIWRYDPVVVNEVLDLNYHKKEFERLCRELQGCMRSITISFVDMYTKLGREKTPAYEKEEEEALRSRAEKQLRPVTEEEMEELAAFFSHTASARGLSVNACCEGKDLVPFGVGRASCIDKAVIEDITGGKLKLKPDKGQRKGCGCYESIDIGAYNTCRNGCIYCYANHSPKSLEENLRKADRQGELLVGSVRDGEKVTVRKTASCLEGQYELPL